MATYMLKTKTNSGSTNLNAGLARGHTSQLTTWRCLNRQRTGVTCSKEQRKKWGYYEVNNTSTVVSHRRTPDICGNDRSFHIHALWMTFYNSNRACGGQRSTWHQQHGYRRKKFNYLFNREKKTFI